jgi:glycosyltransferase involved in cell wall biosynthesis
MPTRDRLEALKRYALPSILKQNFDPSKFEIIIVDNSSTDETWNYLQQASLPSNLCFLRERRPGICRAINLALTKAKGNIITFLEDDLAVDPDWLNRIYSLHRSRHYLIGQGLVYDVSLKRILNEHDNPVVERNFFDGIMSYRREVFNVASFNNYMIYGYESYDFMTQIFTFWPGFSHYLDDTPVQHHRAVSEYRTSSQEELNKKGQKMENRMYEYWYLNRHILQRNLELNDGFYSIRFWFREALFALPELFFVYGNVMILLKLKWRIFKQLQRVRFFDGAST